MKPKPDKPELPLARGLKDLLLQARIEGRQGFDSLVGMKLRIKVKKND